MASLVVKVKYEETLRRFNVAINGDKSLDLNMDGLRVKICSLFNLPLGVKYRLTYQDEDGDLVTLVDDDDLQDVVRQGLDPVRITVHLIPEQSAISSGNAATSTTPSVKAQSDISRNGSEILKSVQEPLSHFMNKLKFFAPNLQRNHNSDVAGNLNSAQQPLPDALPKSNSDGNTPNCESSSTLSRSDGTKKNKDVSSGKIGASQNSLRSVTMDPSRKGSFRNVAERNKKFDTYAAPIYDQLRQSSPLFNRTFMNANSAGPILHPGITCDGCEVAPIAGPRFKSKVKYDYDLCSNCFLVMGNSTDYTRIEFPRNDLLRKNFALANKYYNYPQLPAGGQSYIIHRGIGCDGCGFIPITGPRFKSKVKDDYDLCNICFSLMGNDIDYTRIDVPLVSKHPLPCNVPVKSPRPSMMGPHLLKHLHPRHDSCFVTDVNVMDGTTMAPSTPFTKIWRMRNNGSLPWNRGLQLLWIGGDLFRPSASITIQVPSSGVSVGQELNIAVDFIAPELPGVYISYWRLAVMDGHKFGQRVWVEIQVDPSVDLTREDESSSVSNLNLAPVDSEITFADILDVKAESEFDTGVCESSVPSTLDQNRSIQIVAPKFPINNDMYVADDIVYPNTSSAPAPVDSSDKPASPVAPSSASNPKADAFSYHIPEASDVDVPVSPLAYPSVSSAEMDSLSYHNPEVFASLNVQDNKSTLDESINLEQVGEKTDKQKLLKELEEMGFKQIDLNKKDHCDSGRSVDELGDALSYKIPESSGPVNVLNNKYTLDKNIELEQADEETEVEEKMLAEYEQMGNKHIDLNKEDVGDLNISVDDLGHVSEDDLSDDSEWDPILVELKEMGFEDKDANMKLLAKNNGSISRVVMELIADEEA